MNKIWLGRHYNTKDKVDDNNDKQKYKEESLSMQNIIDMINHRIEELKNSRVEFHYLIKINEDFLKIINKYKNK